MLRSAGRGNPRQLSPYPGAHRLIIIGNFKGYGLPDAGHRQLGDPGRGLIRGAKQGAQRHRPAVVQVRLVLPRVADAAEHLDQAVRAADRGVHGDQVATVAASSRGFRRGRARPRRVPHRGGGLLGLGRHPGAPVLDRLELPDR
jgi:hypothetical protein